MREAESVSSYIAAPAGRFVQGPGWRHGHVDPDLCLLSLSGIVGSEADIVCELIEERRFSFRHLVLDTRRLIVRDHRDFVHPSQVLVTAAERSFLRRVVLTVFRSRGFAGVAVTGALMELEAHDVVFATDELETECEVIRPGLARLAALFFEAAPVPFTADPLLLHLGRVLDSQLHLTIEQAAAMLGLSVRSLQRRFERAGTSFRVEVHRARVRRAQTLLLHSDDKVSTIAQHVGCKSAQHLARLFKSYAAGQTPAAYRRSHA